MSFRGTRLGRMLERWSSRVEEVLRLFYLRALMPAACWILPKPASLRVADLAGLSLLVTVTGIQSWLDFHDAFDQGPVEALGLAAGWLARPFRDFVTHDRLNIGRESLAGRRVVERNVEGVAALRAAGESYIVALGHFSRAALMGLYHVTPGRVLTVRLDPPNEGDLKQKRIHVQLETGVRASHVVHPDTESVIIGSAPSELRKLLTHLREPGSVVFIHIDAPWSADRPASHIRPFAGLRERVFATGAPHLARRTNAPIVVCVCTVDRDGSLVLTWGTPVRLRADDDRAREIEVLDGLIDEIEIAVGEHPTQYVPSIGGERRWNGDRRRWEELSADHQVDRT